MRNKGFAWCRTLMSVDDVIGDVIDLCEQLGVADNTYFLYRCARLRYSTASPWLCGDAYSGSGGWQTRLFLVSITSTPILTRFCLY